MSFCLGVARNGRRERKRGERNWRMLVWLATPLAVEPGAAPLHHHQLLAPFWIAFLKQRHYGVCGEAKADDARRSVPLSHTVSVFSPFFLPLFPIVVEDECLSRLASPFFASSCPLRFISFYCCSGVAAKPSSSSTAWRGCVYIQLVRSSSSDPLS